MAKELMGRYEIDCEYNEATCDDRVTAEKKPDGEWCKWSDVADEIERNRWRSIESELPEVNQVVLCYTPIKEEYIEYRVVVFGRVNTSGNGFPVGITYWRPLIGPEKSEGIK